MPLHPNRLYTFIQLMIYCIEWRIFSPFPLETKSAMRIYQDPACDRLSQQNRFLRKMTNQQSQFWYGSQRMCSFSKSAHRCLTGRYRTLKKLLKSFNKFQNSQGGGILHPKIPTSTLDQSNKISTITISLQHFIIIIFLRSKNLRWSRTVQI